MVRHIARLWRLATAGLLHACCPLRITGLGLYGHDLPPLAASRRGLKGLRRFNPAALGGLGVLFRVRLWSLSRLLPPYSPCRVAHSTPNRS